MTSRMIRHSATTRVISGVLDEVAGDRVRVGGDARGVKRVGHKPTSFVTLHICISQQPVRESGREGRAAERIKPRTRIERCGWTNQLVL